MKIQLEQIAGRDPKLYIALCDTFLIRGTDNIKVLDISDAKFNWLTPEVRDRVLALEKEFESETEAAQQKRAAEDLEKQRKIDADTEVFKNRLMQYVNEQGLEPTLENADAIRKWIDEKVSKGHMSSNAVDAAVSVLRSKLTWKPKAPAAPPTPPTPPAVILSDGSEQLPLDAAPTYKHTKAQLADLAKRQIAATKKDRGGWHGATL